MQHCFRTSGKGACLMLQRLVACTMAACGCRQLVVLLQRFRGRVQVDTSQGVGHGACWSHLIWEGPVPEQAGWWGWALQPMAPRAKSCRCSCACPL